MLDYNEFLRSKKPLAVARGFEPRELHPRHFPFQRDAVTWAVRQGRAALFEDTGLGKTGQQIEWARQVQLHTQGRVLIVAPLAVASQTITEASRLDVELVYVRDQSEVIEAGVYITNYDRIQSFDGSQWQGVVLDESSILKSFSGKTKRALISQFQSTPYRLACTATPSPNDYMELGNHAEFLGVMDSGEMLMRWFLNDTMKAGGYRLKGHAEDEFWQWVASWAACISKPSDLGYSDDGYDLPALSLYQHTVAADYDRLISETGSFVPSATVSATKLWKDKKETAAARCAMAAEIVLSQPDEPWVLWVNTNEEADLLLKALPTGLTADVRGNEKSEAKERKLAAFASGEVRYLITKPKIAGFGLNWQHCARMCFVGLTYSFEMFYQSLRRCYRFGQQRPVNAYLVVAETESNVLAAINEKQDQHRQMQSKMTSAMREVGLLAQQHQTLRLYEAHIPMQLPVWLRKKVV
jgi:superfamily II DNA or RNA helicase